MRSWRTSSCTRRSRSSSSSPSTAGGTSSTGRGSRRSGSTSRSARRRSRARSSSASSSRSGTPSSRAFSGRCSRSRCLACAPWCRTPIDALAYMTLVTPEIVFAIAALVFFVQAGTRVGLDSPLGWQTILIAHVVFNTSVVALVVRARFVSMGQSLEEASFDLGAGPLSTFRQVTLPRLAPAILAGGCSRSPSRSTTSSRRSSSPGRRRRRCRSTSGASFASA